MLDTRGAFQDILSRADSLIEKTAARVAASPVAAATEAKTAERIAAIDEAVAETHVDAAEALTKLAAAQKNKIARRAAKIAEICHIARVADRLLAS